MDFHCDGKVNYSEFLAATISSINFCKEEKLWLTFKYFDTTDSGFITLDTVIEALKESGVVVDEQGLNETFIGMKKKGEKIGFNEFKSLALGNGVKNNVNDNESEIKDNTLSINDKYSNNEKCSNNLNAHNINIMTKKTVQNGDIKDDRDNNL